MEDWIWCVFGLPLIVIASIILWNNRTKKLCQDAWPKLAERTGLSFSGSPEQVAGTYRGRSLKLHAYLNLLSLLTPQNPLIYTRITLSVNTPVETRLSLSQKGRLKVGGQFDQRFVIRSQPRELATHVFASSELRERILLTYSPAFNLAGRELIWKRAVKSGSEVETDVKYLHYLFDTLCEMAEVAERAQERDTNPKMRQDT